MVRHAVPVLYLFEAAWGFVLDQYGTPELKAEVLPKVTAGKAFLGIATTEPKGGSDILGTCRTKAVQESDGWVLNSEKAYISGVRESLEMGGVHLLLARTEPNPAARHKAFTFFALPLKDTPGVNPTLRPFPKAKGTCG